MSTDGRRTSKDFSTQNTYDDSWSQEMASQCTRFGRVLGSVIIADAAQRDGAEVTWIGSRMAVTVIDGRRVSVVGSSGSESALSAAVEGDKLLTKRLLDEVGVSTPSGRIATSEEDTVAAQRELGRTVVVKPRYGAMGKGVTVNIDDENDLRAAFRRARGSAGDVLVEEYIKGAEYRGHGSSEECVAVFKRLLPSVTGNGRDSVTELVASKNSVRKLNPNTMTNPIILDAVADGALSRQGLDRDSIIPEGQTVIVREVNGITGGGDSRECLDDCPVNVRTATSAAIAAIPGMDWGGTDIIVRDGTDEAFVMEVNTVASIGGSVFPVYGKPRDTAAEVWRRIRERAVPEVTRRDSIPEVHQRPVNVCAIERHGVATNLTSVFQHILRARGYEIDTQGRSTYRALHANEVLWFAGCLTTADVSRSQRTILKQRGLWGLLQAQEVSQVAGRRVTDVAQLRSFTRGHNEMTLMIPVGGRFDDRNVRLLPSQAQTSETSIAGRRSWLVQEYPAGRRFTVIASRGDALAVVGRRCAERVSESEVQRVAEVAVDAVRAVPELRWAAVQLVVPQLGEEPLVEGMTNRPVFSPGDYLVAGSFEDFADLVLEGAKRGV